ncbi:MAG: ABC transporter substrate-binding protein [Clostridia bacterium]|nr:ABC transporter substrate-binding protein [Clostridia bacterium]
MKLHIDTAPVWEAYRQDSECPLCLLQQRVESRSIDYFLGESVMEPDQRIEVNRKGFCSRHFKQMYEAGNRLGLALMTHTHLKETIRSLREDVRLLNEATADEAARSVVARLIGKRRASYGDLTAKWTDPGRDCVMCERIEKSMQRYCYTVAYLFGTDSAFAEAFERSKGMCLPHCAQTLEIAGEQLSGETLRRFVSSLTALQLANLERLEGEVDWFTRKFDYRNDDKPWGNSRDAVKRAVNKLRSHTITD